MDNVVLPHQGHSLHSSYHTCSHSVSSAESRWTHTMKVLAIIDMPRGGGAQRVLSRLTQEWGMSHQVVTVFFDASNLRYDYRGTIVDLRVPASDNLLRKVYNVWVRAIRLRCLLRQECPDRIFSFQEGANFPVIAAATLVGCLGRLYVSVRDNPATFLFLFRTLIPLLYRLPAGVVAVSDGVKQGLELRHVSATKISVIPNPISRTDKQAIGQKSVAPLPNRFILGVGRLDRQKGFDRLLEAFHRLGRPELHLVILGEGEERLELINLSRELGIEKRVHFPGYVTDVETWYRHAECFVLSSRHEGWPNVLMEAMAEGCSVISFDCKYGPSEIIRDGENGLLVPEGDVEGLTKSIARVLDDKALRRDLVVKGMERVKMFEVKEIAARWLVLGSNADVFQNHH